MNEGLDHVVHEVNGELIVRFDKELDPVRRASSIEREARLLAAVAEISPVPVPEPVFVLAERGYLGYFKLPGVPLLELPRASWSAHGPTVAATLLDVLAAVRDAPAGRWSGLVEVDVEPLAGWLAEAAETYDLVAREVPAAHRGAVEAFLRAAPPPDPRETVFSHNDLGIEHVLVDPATCAVTGIIDWSDAALVDPAYDLALLLRDLGPAALGDLPVGDRAVFYARCKLLEDLAYGLESGRAAYVEKSHAALAWLF
ncbi:aminoglycoside phosphotransferase family protein [Asanoa sp. NPDC050611]|uniref:phosphotransferase family protein n=1 Tax=Asanoa sp. NPDC050611 TaxID=3157098 RepID=UPI0033D51539